MTKDRRRPLNPGDIGEIVARASDEEEGKSEEAKNETVASLAVACCDGINSCVCYLGGESQVSVRGQNCGLRRIDKNPDCFSFADGIDPAHENGS